MLNQFIAQFTHEKIDYVKRGDSFFRVTQEILSHEKRITPKPISIGLLLGKIEHKTFFPSLPLLSWLAPRTKQKVMITDKAEWLFLCGRDVSKESIIKKEGTQKCVLVQNKHEENLGYGELTSKGIRNLLDRGDYLRRERKSSKAV